MKITVAVPDQAMQSRLSASAGEDVDLVVWRPGDDALEQTIDLLVMPYTVSYESLRGLGGRVRHIQSQSLGYDGANQSVPEGVTFSNAVGVHEAPTAEMANDGKPYVGHAGMRKYYDDVASVWIELDVTPSEIREVGDAVLVLGRVYGRAGGGYIQDSPAQWVMRFRDGRVSWIRVFTNRSAALAEVGLPE